MVAAKGIWEIKDREKKIKDRKVMVFTRQRQKKYTLYAQSV